ncbi:MAG: NfeD family protein [Magnetococcales bacterium]|nr:NfeD family protein [Magnetococcales bacterium]
MESYFAQLTHWHWAILAVGFTIVEVLLPVFVFLWLGLAAGLTAVVKYLHPAFSWEGQFLLFCATALLTIAVWHGLLRKRPSAVGDSTLNRRGTQYIGQVFTLEQPIVDGVGHLRVDDTFWRLQGPELTAGAKVRVTEVVGNALKVEAV